MTIKLIFFVDGEPCPKQSVRFAKVGGFVKTFQPKKVTDYAEKVAECFREAYPEHDCDSLKRKMLTIKITAYFSIPKSKSKKFKELAESGKVRPITRPDTDNIAKNIKDALNKVAYLDDSQIVTEIIEKWYSGKPRVEIIITEME